MVSSGLVRLFSYGTLQLPDVQRASFGRLVDGRPDVLPGYRLDDILIRNPEVVGLSGIETHRIARRGGPDDKVPGVVLSITEAELAQADDYETDDYVRRDLRMKSGEMAFVYVAAHDGL